MPHPDQLEAFRLVAAAEVEPLAAFCLALLLKEGRAMARRQDRFDYTLGAPAARVAHIKMRFCNVVDFCQTVPRVKGLLTRMAAECPSAMRANLFVFFVLELRLVKTNMPSEHVQRDLESAVEHLRTDLPAADALLFSRERKFLDSRESWPKKKTKRRLTRGDGTCCKRQRRMPKFDASKATELVEDPVSCDDTASETN